MALSQTQVSQLYVSIFGRASEGEGNTFWQQGADMVSTATEMLATPQAVAYFGDTLTDNQAFIEHIYLNTLGKTYADDPDGIDYWTGRLDAGESQGTIIADLIAAAQAPENAGDAQDQFNNKVAISNYTADNIENVTTLSTFAGFIDEVDHTQASVTDAMAEVDTATPGTLSVNLEVEAAAGADVMRLTGNQDVRIDLTGNDNQLEGIDLDNDGVIEHDGVENNDPTTQDDGVDFEIVDAYTRNPLNHSDFGSNFLGDIDFDGTGFAGDGVNTDGNIFLGGLGADTALGGIGNDFLAGGGVSTERYVQEYDTDTGTWIWRDTITDEIYQLNPAGQDSLSGGRNADFFFTELSLLDFTDGDSLVIDGGSTSDDAAAGDGTPQDSDWLLIEASDDDEPVDIDLALQSVTPNSAPNIVIINIENVDASGNLYGFLDDINTTIGGKAGEVFTPGEGNENVGLGSSAQLIIDGSNENNILIGGFDNDRIDGDTGDDLIFGGRLDYNNNPNLIDIVNDGVDELTGGGGNDDIVFELDGGVYEGGATADINDGPVSPVMTDAAGTPVDPVVLADDFDTLWLTENVAGTSTVDALTTDNTIRIDLAAGKLGGLVNAAGYGGADQDYADAVLTTHYTADQTNYLNEADRAQVQDFENVNATGLGNVDYLAAGTNDPDLAFRNQQQLNGLEGANLDLRGTSNDLDNDGDDENYLYANSGDDILEGREGNDRLMGGEGNDDFIFQIAGQNGNNDGDDLDVIHRLMDANNDGLWDGTYGADFGTAGPVIASDSSLTLTLVNNDDPASELADFPVTGIVFNLNGTQYTVESTEMGDATTYSDFTAELNTALDAHADTAGLTAALNADNTITITDPAGATFEVVGYTWVGDVAPAAGNLIWNMTVGDPTVEQAEDRLIFASYEDRADGELVDDDGTVNHTGDAVSLGRDGYAEDLVVQFDSDGNGTTVLAEDQAWALQFANIADEDDVTIAVNGTAFNLKMGVQADGTRILENMDDFLQRVTDLINSGSDNDTLAGTIVAAFDGVDTITLTQGNYNGGQVVFMSLPEVTLGNLSGGEPASVMVFNNANSEVTLFEYNGRDANLNADNVLFLGGSGMNNGVVTNADNSRSILATADDDADGTLTGSDALILDSMTDADTVATDFAIHGDDLFFTGNANDTVNAGTGDDTIYGSVGNDTVDGGKDIYVVQTLVAGEVVETTAVMNAYDAAQRAGEIGVIDVFLIEQDAVSATGLVNRAGYADTLVFSTADFAGTRFTVTVDDDLEQQDGGAGTVGVDEGDDGTIDHITTFTEMEAIRTLAGDGTHAGQGHDTLDVSALSDAVAASDAGDPDAAVIYNMTSDLGMIEINADLNDDGEIADDNAVVGDATGDEIDTFLAVDGVEILIGGNANEQLNIDESEVLKDNSFYGGDEVTLEDDDDATTTDDPDLVGDSIVYDHTDMDNDGDLDDDGDIDDDNDGLIDSLDTDDDNDLVADENEDFDGDFILDGVDDSDGDGVVDLYDDTAADRMDDVAVSMRPSMEIVVESDSETDLVNLTGGTIVGSDTTVDTLVDVETIDIANAAISATLDDTLNVSNINGATVDFTAGEVLDGDDVLAQITGMTQLEETLGGAGSDTVEVADAMGNYRAYDSADATTSISYDSFLSYDTFEDTDADGVNDARTAFNDIAAAARPEANNQALFSFDLAGGTDRVSYYNETGNIGAVVDLEEGEAAQTVFVMGADNLLTAANDRIDLLQNVEEVVASQGESILDFTGADTNLAISYMSAVDATTIGALDLREHTISIEDLDSSVPFGDFSYVEFMDADQDDDIAVNPAALWDRIEGSDNNEKVELTDDQSGNVHTFNLRGGDNEVNYNELTRGIELSVQDLTAGVTSLNIQAKDTAGVIFNAGDLNANGIIDGVEVWTQYDRITSYNSQNDITVGSLRIEASQSEDDSINLASVTANNLVILGDKEGSSDILTVTFDDGGEDEVNLTLTGFESFIDGAGDDVYQINDLSDFINTLILTDTVGDRDTIKLTNDAFENTPAINITQNLHMGDGDVNDLEGPNNLADAAGFDFDVLDISEVTDQSNITATGDAAEADNEIIVGDLADINTITNFDILSLSSATLGTSFDFDLDADELQDATNATLVDFNADMDTLDASRMTADLNLTVTDDGAVGATVIGGEGNDNITGGAGSDTLQGGQGNDVLDGSFVPVVQEVHSFTLTGTLSVTANNDWGITFSDDSGNTVVLNEAALTAGAGTNAGTIATGASYIQIGNAIESLDFSALDLDADGTASDIESVSFDDGTGVLSFTMTADHAGVENFGTTSTGSADGDFNLNFTTAGDTAAVAPGTVQINAVADTGLPGVDAVQVEGAAQGESRDIYVFEATAAANGQDTINNFNSAGAPPNRDQLDFNAFLGGTGAFNVPVFTTASVGNVNLDNDVSRWDANGTALTAASLAAEFAGGGTAFSSLADDVAVIVEIDSTTAGEDANIWFVSDLDGDAAITEDEVSLVGVVTDGGDIAYAAINFIV